MVFLEDCLALIGTTARCFWGIRGRTRSIFILCRFWVDKSPYRSWKCCSYTGCLLSGCWLKPSQHWDSWLSSSIPGYWVLAIVFWVRSPWTVWSSCCWVLSWSPCFLLATFCICFWAVSFHSTTTWFVICSSRMCSRPAWFSKHCLASLLDLHLFWPVFDFSLPALCISAWKIEFILLVARITSGSMPACGDCRLYEYAMFFEPHLQGYSIAHSPAASTLQSLLRIYQRAAFFRSTRVL